MDNLIVSTSPHVLNKHNTTRRIMLDVLIALVPALICAIVYFGYMVAINAVVCMVSCIAFELIYDCITNGWNKQTIRKSTVWNMSCCVTGLLLALNLPTYINAWGLNILQNSNVVFSFDTVIICIIASAFAIIVVKQLFGGIGKNIVNPALAGRVFIFLCFGAKFASIANVFDATTSATWLSTKGAIDGNVLLNMLFGLTGSAGVGETCAIAIIAGYVYLVARKVIDWRLPLVVVASAFVFALLFDGVVNGLSGIDLLFNACAHVLSGGLLFGAVFMATDYATNPNTTLGKIIFALGIGFITMLIRCFAGYPEGVSFAILIMNVFTPLIDKFVYPRPFGWVKPKKEGK